MIKDRLGILALVIAVGCSGGSSVREHAADIYTLTQRVQEAAESQTSHRFRASWEVRIPEQMAAEKLESGQVNTEGQFAAPHKIHLRHLATDPDLLDEAVPYEVLYDGDRVFLKETEGAAWEESAGPTGLSALLAGPALGEVLQWMLLLRDVEFLGSERIDSVDTVHLRGRVRQAHDRRA